MLSRVVRVAATSTASRALLHSSRACFMPVPVSERVLLPALSPTMTSGTIAAWHKKEGDLVKVGDVLFEIETDKAQMEVEASEEGVLAKIFHPAKSTNLPISTVVAVMVAPGSDYKDVDLSGISAAPAPSPASASAASVATKAPAAIPAAAASPALHVSSSSAKHEKQQFDASKPLFPSVSHLVSLYNLDPSVIPATGPKNRLLKGDVLHYIEVTGAKRSAHKPSSSAAHTASKSPVAATRSATQGKAAIASSDPDAAPTNIPLKPEEKEAMNQLLAAKKSAAHVYLNAEADVSTLSELKSIANDVPSFYASFVVRAAASALKQVPALENPSRRSGVGLILNDGTTVIIDSETNPSTIAKQIKDLQALSSAGQPLPAASQASPGPLIVVRDLSSTDLRSSTAILTSPAILTIHACRRALAAVKVDPDVDVIDEQENASAALPSFTYRMETSLTTDGIYWDDFEASQLLSAVVSRLENPFE